MPLHRWFVRLSLVVLISILGACVPPARASAAPPAQDDTPVEADRWRSPGATVGTTQFAGDDDGIEINTAALAHDDGVFAEDRDSGTNISLSCDDGGKDRHQFLNYDIDLPSSAYIYGIEVQIQAKADRDGRAMFCVELSGDNGLTWSVAKESQLLTTAEGAYTLGGKNDRWGQTWDSAKLKNANFRVRLTSITNTNDRDIWVDWVGVRVTSLPYSHRLLRGRTSGLGSSGLFGGNNDCGVIFTNRNINLDIPLATNQVWEFNKQVMFRSYTGGGPEGAKLQIFSTADPMLFVVSIAGSEGAVSQTSLNNLFPQNLFDEVGDLFNGRNPSSYQSMVELGLTDAIAGYFDGNVDIPPLIPAGARLIVTGHSQGGNVSQNVARIINDNPLIALPDSQSARLVQVARSKDVRVRQVIVAGSRITLWANGQNTYVNGRTQGNFVYGMREITDPVPMATATLIVPGLALIGSLGFLASTIATQALAGVITFSPLAYLPLLHLPVLSGAMFAPLLLPILMVVASVLYIYLSIYIARAFFAERRNRLNFLDNDGLKYIAAHTGSYIKQANAVMTTLLTDVDPSNPLREGVTYIGGYGYDCAPSTAQHLGARGDGYLDEEWQWDSRLPPASYDGTLPSMRRELPVPGCYTRVNHAIGIPPCEPPADPQTVSVTIPNGHPDDFEAPWTVDGANNSSNEFISSLVPDRSVRLGSPAWLQMAKQALSQRIETAQAQNAPIAAAYYQTFLTGLETGDTLVPALVNLSDADRNRMAAMTARNGDLLEEMQFEFDLGTRNGVPASVDEIRAHWRQVADADPIVRAWRESSGGQRYEAAMAPLITSADSFAALQAASPLSAMDRQLAAIENQARTQGVGVLVGGLGDITAKSLGHVGVPAQRVDPLTTGPRQAPSAIVVPTGALEYYRNFPRVRQWLDTYVASGGTLLVLAQPKGENWAFLPGGQVRGLGYEEDILCKDDSVDVYAASPYVGGIFRDRASIQIDGSFTQYPPDTEILFMRRTGNRMPAMIRYTHGLGQVIATSAYPDFASINGSSSFEDLPFTRNLFLQLWRDAADVPLIGTVTRRQASPLAVPIRNTGTTAMRQAQLVTDISDGVAPSEWSWGGWKASTEDFVQQVAVVLNPPLLPGDTRTVTVTMPAARYPGLHRLGINGAPGPLYRVSTPYTFESPLFVSAATDKAAYWTDDIARLTLTLSPTARLAATAAYTVSFDGLSLPPRRITVEPGQQVSFEASLLLTEAIIGRPARITVRDAASAALIARTSAPLQISARPTPARLSFAPPTRGLWVGDTATITTWIAPTSELTRATTLRLTADVAAFPSQQFDLAPGAPLTITSQLIASSELITRPLLLTLTNATTGDVYGRGQLALPVAQVAPRLGLSTGAASSTNLDFAIENGGGTPASYAGQVTLRDDGGRIIATRAVSGALAAATPNEHLPTRQPQALALSGRQAASAHYELSYALTATSGLRWSGAVPVALAGITATLQTRTERLTYLVSETITTTTGISTSAPGASTLKLQVLRFGSGAVLDVATLAGSAGSAGSANGSGAVARFNQPYSVSLSADGRVALVADTFNHTIRRIDVASGGAVTVAGSAGSAGSANGTGPAARFSRPRGVALSADGGWALVSDTNNHTIRRIDLATGAVTTLAGTPGISGTANGTGPAARFSFPDDVVISGGSALVADTGNHTIRRIDLATGAVTTLAGTPGSTGSTNGTGAAARFNAPQGIAVSGNGALALVADTANGIIRRIDLATGAVTTVAGVAGNFGSADGTGPAARFSSPQGIALTADGSVALISDTTNHNIRRLTLASRVVTTAAGGATLAGSADGTGLSARFFRPRSIALSGDGALALVADSDNHTLRTLGFAQLIREDLVAVPAGSPLTVTHALLDPPLALDQRARGPLLLRGTYYGPEPAAAAPTARQVLAVGQAGFVVVPGAYTITLVPDVEQVRLNLPGPTDDVAARLILRGTVRNTTPFTGVTLLVSDNGAPLPSITLPDLAPGARGDFSFQPQPAAAGTHTYAVQAPAGDVARRDVQVLPPTLQAGPVLGAGRTMEPGERATLTLPLTNTSQVIGFATVAVPQQAPQTFELAPRTSASASFQITVPETATAGLYTVPFAITGDTPRTILAQLHVTGTLAMPPGGFPAPINALDGDVCRVTITSVTLSRPAVASGETFSATVLLQPESSGRQVLDVRALETHVQRPLRCVAQEPLTSVVAITVPSTVPAGTYALDVAVGDARTSVPITVLGWAAALELRVPTAAIPHRQPFATTVIISETRGMRSPVTLAVRYDGEEYSRTLVLQPNQVVTHTAVFTANVGAGRVIAALGADRGASDEVGYQPIIDARPVTIYTGAAYVQLTPLQASAGTTITGELVITGPITAATVQLPESISGQVLVAANLFAAAKLDNELLINLQQTPTGRWTFPVPIPADTQRGRYILEVTINGQERPVPFEVEGPQALVRQADIARLDACSPQLTLTMDVESVTSLVISPTVYFDNQLVPTTAGLITLAGGRQPVRLPVTLPATAQSSGLLTVVFNTVDGVPVGGLTTALQVGGVELTALTLEGANRSAPVNARLDVFGNGPATLVLTPDVGQPVTTTVQLSGYQSLTIPYVVPPGARTLTALLREPRGCAASRTLVINQALPDTEAPSVALGTIAAPAGTATVAPIFVSGTAQDGGSGLCALTINGQTPSFDPRTGAYSMTIQFPPGNHVITATAFDCDGNRSDSPPQAISIARVFPAAQFANAALTASESAPALRVGVTLDQASSITGTVQYATDGGSATAGADYVATSGTLVFAPLQTTAWLTVTLRGDSLDEASETIQLQLANPVNASLGLTATTTLTLLDDDALPALAPASPPPVSEAAGTATLTVTLSAPSGQLVRVAYATVDGTARAGADYAQTNGILTFPAGTTTQTIRVPLFRDVLAEADELFRVDLSAPSNATLSSASSTVTITDEVLTNTGLWLPFVIR